MTWILLAVILICDMWIIFRIAQMLGTGALKLNDHVWRWRTDPLVFGAALAFHIAILCYGIYGLCVQVGLKFHG